MDYENKYLKYKNKYLALKKMLGGGLYDDITASLNEFIKTIPVNSYNESPDFPTTFTSKTGIKFEASKPLIKIIFTNGYVLSFMKEDRNYICDVTYNFIYGDEAYRINILLPLFKPLFSQMKVKTIILAENILVGCDAFKENKQLLDTVQSGQLLFSIGMLKIIKGKTPPLKELSYKYTADTDKMINYIQLNAMFDKNPEIFVKPEVSTLIDTLKVEDNGENFIKTCDRMHDLLSTGYLAENPNRKFTFSFDTGINKIISNNKRFIFTYLYTF